MDARRTTVDHLWDVIEGNERLKSELRSDLADDKLAHAYILEGPSGSGKKLLAKTVCAAMTKNLDMAEKIFDGYCPDLFMVSRQKGKKTLGVDEIRNIRAGAYIKANDLEFKAYLIEDAGTMTVQAQNALLKLLEEPPASVLFFLMCENASALLPTVRSRAPILRMQVFSRSETEEILVRKDRRAQLMKNSSPEEWEHLLAASAGCIGQALERLEKAKKEQLSSDSDVLKFLDRIVARSYGDIYLACLSLPDEREELGRFYFSCQVALRDLMAMRTAKSPELLFGQETRLQGIAKRTSFGKLLYLEGVFAEALERLACNINLLNSKISLASEICRKR